MQIYLIFSLIIAVLAVLFAVQNNQPVTVTFLFWSVETTSAMVIILSILTGVLISSLASLPSLAKNKLGTRGQRKRIAELEAGLNDANAKLAGAEKTAAELEKSLSEVNNPPPPPLST